MTINDLENQLNMIISGSTLANSYLDSFVTRANDAIFMKLIRNVHDLEDDEKCFHPEFTHQIFGENENIFGYTDLKIKMFYSSSKLERFIGIEYSEKVDTKASKGVEGDDILSLIKEKIPGEFTSNIDEFSKRLESEFEFKPMGEKLNEFTVDHEGVERTFEVYRCTVTDPGFMKYHGKMQTWLLWFIDGASYIDIDDDRWEFFILFQKSGSTSNNNGNSNSNGHRNGSSSLSSHQFVGYTSVYRYYAYFDKIRPRISQVLILPPFQRQGLGAKLLETIYSHYQGQGDVLDITVEDPSDNFVGLRDYVDCKKCLSLKSFQKEFLLKGWCEEMAKEAQSALKLNKKQARRVYEILKLRHIDRNNPEEYRKYRLEVKNRLNAPFIKMDQKQETSVEPGVAGKELRVEQLRQMFQEVEEEYSQTINKLDLVA